MDDVQNRESKIRRVRSPPQTRRKRFARMRFITSAKKLIVYFLIDTYCKEEIFLNLKIFLQVKIK